MNDYIPFSKDDIMRASQTDLEDFLRRRGETLKRSGSEWQWGDGSSKVTVRGNEWFHQYQREGGDAIAFVRRWYNLDFPEAVTFLLQEQGLAVPNPGDTPKQKEKKPFVLPEAHSDMRRVYAYLLKVRFIDREVISFFAHQGMLYEDAKFHNAVFVGFDEHGVARHAHKRGTCSESGYKGNVTGSLPEHSFHHIGRASPAGSSRSKSSLEQNLSVSCPSNRLYVFEAPIDLLSYITLHPERWQEHSYVALCCAGLQAAIYQARQNPHIREVVVCTDHDEAGIEAYHRIKDELTGIGAYTVRQELASNKDWNEDIKDRHGLEPIPGSEHPRIEFLRELCDQLVTDGLPPCPARPLEELRDRVMALKRTDPDNQTAIGEQACELSGLALSFCQNRARQLGLEADARKITAGMLSRYQPHRDHSGYKNRIRELEDGVRGLLRDFRTDRIYTESELKQQINRTLDLALGGLRLHAFAELQTPEQAALLTM